MNRRRLLIIGAAGVGLLIIIALAWWIMPSGHDHAGHDHDHADDGSGASQIWTCSMHPQIRRESFGECPICNMDLIPVADDGDDPGPRSLRWSPHAVALAQLRTAPVRRRFVAHTRDLNATLVWDERHLQRLVTRLPARIEVLHVQVVGQRLEAGEPVAELYAPGLIVLQQELLQAHRRDDTALLAAARDKLRQWGFPASLAEDIIAHDAVRDTLPWPAPEGGVVTAIHVQAGERLGEGQALLSLADPTRLWAYLDAYQSDLPELRYAQPVQLTFGASATHQGRIAFIPPEIDPRRRSARVRVDLRDVHGDLRPGMYGSARVSVYVAEEGIVADPAIAERWLSPVDPDHQADAPGTCPISGLPLQQPVAFGYRALDESGSPLVVPHAAILATGRRAVVYIQEPGLDDEAMVFTGRTVTLGPRAGAMQVIRDGLFEGELVVVNGQFKIDSALQIQAKTSMMSLDDEQTRPGHWRHYAPEVDPGREAFRDQRYQALDLRLSAPQDAALAEVVLAVVRLQESLAADRLEDQAWETLAEVVTAAAQLDLHGDDALWWQEQIARLRRAAEPGPDIASARRRFATLMAILLSIERQVGVPSGLETLDQVFCPMAFDDRGAAWWQQRGPVVNPYFGAEMLRCGLIERHLGDGTTPPPASAPDGGGGGHQHH